MQHQALLKSVLDLLKGVQELHALQDKSMRGRPVLVWSCCITRCTRNSRHH